MLWSNDQKLNFCEIIFHGIVSRKWTFKTKLTNDESTLGTVLPRRMYLLERISNNNFSNNYFIDKHVSGKKDVGTDGGRFYSSWWRHQMKIFPALLAICAGNSPVTGEFPAQRPVTRSFDIFYDLRLNKRLSKQWCGWWFETPSHPLWHHCNVPLHFATGAITQPCCYWFKTHWRSCVFTVMDQTGNWSD